jgi:biotin synthase
MSANLLDAGNRARIAALGRRVLAGGAVRRAEALWLFNLQSQADLWELFSWANRLRVHFHGNKVRLCSIINVKAGGCTEDCRFCAQSAFSHAQSPRHALLGRQAVLAAADEAKANRVSALGLVAARADLEAGPALDALCRRLEELKRSGKARPDASLGIIRSRKVAERLKQAGLECYNHNLETSRRFFPHVCSSHTYEERLQTIGYLRQVGLKICSGGILGLGETAQDRCDLAFALKELGVDIVPLNFLNPIPGTPLAARPLLPPLEALKAIACFRFILPRQQITVAGGRTVTLRDLQALMFLAGASALLVGNYLTTPNRPVAQDLQMLADLALEPHCEPPP